MLKTNLSYFFLVSVSTLLISGSCKKPESFLKHKNVKGFVIEKETCFGNSENEYWLVDLTFLANTPQYGDTLILNGVTYTNVIKTKGLSVQKEIGRRVTIDFDVITDSKIQTTGCTVPNPITYNLKELFVINIGRIP